ncbi:flavodoxin-dependent (E)-4-hydroxy-3-methylbut-2-enyl-diphosphate synthase [Adlercreutzia murintestinalis]|uniref:flavodoxin-dependent (E)-4-hydroxy-3-methylbut-2-enyl-diphosphate synthase n=1 Tax=Adlercreutzia murintestinalis TaxID=2941325 RepID=UPI002557D369|nr:flavodoxin-dependent (E)-4-hydroxy-3-methylbut-2-enyl-diphosphate synthase [Adlercreutzia murintestinalis]
MNKPQMAKERPEAPQMPRTMTHQVMVGRSGHGGVAVGGGAPVSVQSMLNAPVHDVDANLRQIEALAEVGCEIVRMAIPERTALRSFAQVCARSPLPVVADVHFDAHIALEAAWSGAAKLRINPGNIGGLAKTDQVIDAARGAGIPIRIGVNAGSLDASIAARRDLTLPQKLAESAVQYVRYFEEDRGFRDLVVSAKAHDVPATIATYRILSQRLPHVPLHIGITEAGTVMQGTIKSAAGLGVLLEQGIGDTMRISLTDDPTLEVRAAWQLLAALDMRRRTPEMISCPTCGRCQVDMIPIAKQVEEALSHVAKPIKVAVMGCVVNGPGEAADADVGVACGAGQAALFRNGKIVAKVDESRIVDALLEEVEKL